MSEVIEQALSTTRIKDMLLELQQNTTQSIEAGLANVGFYDALMAECPETSYFYLDSQGLNMSVTGKKADLVRILRKFYKLGFTTEKKPGSEDTGYATWFRREECTVWFSFTSSQCKRVQVGTKMAEIPVYEMECAETLEVDTDAL